jgi:ribosomal protein S18 acetylase RimI-like enzyme
VGQHLSADGDDQRGLLMAMEQNLAEHACHLHRKLTGATVTRSDDLVIADSGLDDDTFNIVAAARFTQRSAQRRIAETMAFLDATGRTFAWWVGPTSTPADLAARLVEAGLPASEREAAMWAPISGVAAAPPPPGLAVRLVASRAELTDFAAVVAANWEPPAPVVRQFYAAAAPQALADGCPARYLVGYHSVGYHRERPVCAAEVFLHGGVAGLYSVSTLAPYRRLGFGQAVTLAALDAARRAGYATAVLQASEDGERLYRRLGFKSAATVTEHAIPGLVTGPSAQPW